MHWDATVEPRAVVLLWAGQGVQAEEALSPGEAPKVPAGHALQTLAPALL
jgi:hypothetical protein